MEIDHQQEQVFWDQVKHEGLTLSSPNETYRILIAALDLGWQVEEPVYLRPQWIDAGPWLFHFILKHGANPHPHLIVTRQSPEIEQLIAEEKWQVARYPGNSLPA